MMFSRRMPFGLCPSMSRPAGRSASVKLVEQAAWPPMFFISLAEAGLKSFRSLSPDSDLMAALRHMFTPEAIICLTMRLIRFIFRMWVSMVLGIEYFLGCRYV
jgi:hypothetical protein